MKWGRVLLPLVSVGLGLAVAEGHVFEHPKILRLGVLPDRLLVSITYDLNPGRESMEARGLFDRNQDGILDPEEQVKFARFLEESATLFLEVKIDGQPIKLTRVEASPHLLDRPAGSSETAGIGLLFAVPLKEGPVTIAVRDRDRDKQKHVPVVVDLAPTWSVALASQGELSHVERRIERVMLGPGADLELRLVKKPTLDRPPT